MVKRGRAPYSRQRTTTTQSRSATGTRPKELRMYLLAAQCSSLARANIQLHFESAKLFAISIKKRNRRLFLSRDAVHHFSLCAVDDLTRNVGNLRCSLISIFRSRSSAYTRPKSAVNSRMFSIPFIISLFFNFSI